MPVVIAEWLVGAAEVDAAEDAAYGPTAVATSREGVGAA